MITVDVVIAGANMDAVAAAIDAVRQGKTVLVVIRSRRTGVARTFRQSLTAAAVLRQ